MAVRTNRDHLVKVAVEGQIAPQEFELGWTTPYLVSHEGVPRIVPGTGGITYNARVGDRIRGLVGDHIEPAVSARNPDPRANAGFNILSCVGNRATVIGGDAKGALGTVTGTHGGIEHVMIDFAEDVPRQLVIVDSDSSFGRQYFGGAVSVGIVVHGDSYNAGHGPGVTGLLTSRLGEIEPVLDAGANIADLLWLR